MPDLSHLWQRFLLASSLLVGLAIGAAATVFGYSNQGSVNVHWSVFHIDGVPLWTVAVIPIAIVLVAGTLYHWYDSFHHFTEHMRHRRRVHELEVEVASLRAHLDQVLDMPDHSTSKLPRKPITTEPIPAATEPSIQALLESERDAVSALHESSSVSPGPKTSRSKRVTLAVEPAAAKTNGVAEAAAAESSPEPTIGA